jgi:hypothetical protein
MVGLHRERRERETTMPKVKQPGRTTRLLFNLDQTAELCQLHPQILRNWLAEGRIEPACRGGPGRGCGHSFSGQQVLGLSVALAMKYTCRGASRDFVDRILASFTAMGDAALAEWLRVGEDARAQESAAAWLAGIPGPKDGMNPLVDPQELALDLQLIKERLAPVEAALRARLGPAADRLRGR